MQPGETRSYSQQVSVNYLDASDQKYSGSLNGAYTYVGSYQVTVPAGTFQAVLFRVKCEGKVGPAHTHNTAYNFFAPGVGMVAMILEEDVTAFWLFNIDSTTKARCWCRNEMLQCSEARTSSLPKKCDV